MAFLNDMTIRARIGSGFAMITALLCGVGAFAAFSMNDAQDDFSSYRLLALQTNQIGGVQSNLLATRLAAKDFVLEGTQESIDDVHQRALQTTEMISKGLEIADNDAERKTLQAINSEMETYQQAFDQITEYHKRQSELVQGAIDTIGARIQTALGDIMEQSNDDGRINTVFQAGKSLKHLLLGNTYVQQFLATNDQTYADLAITQIDKGKEFLALMLADQNLVFLHDEIKTLQTDLGTYRSAFQEVTQVIVQQNVLIQETLDPVGDRIAASIEKTETENEQTQSTIGERLVAELDAAVNTSMAVIGISVLLAILASVIVTKGIVAPVRSMTSAMSELAEGNLKITIPCSGQSNELGNMAEAVTIFRDNAEEVERLKAEQEEAERRKAEEKRNMMESMANNFESDVGHIISEVASASKRMQDSASSMTATAEDTNQRSITVSSAVDQASSNVQTVASATEELSSSIGEITRQVDQSTSIARQAISEVTKMGDEMDELRETVGAIGSVIALITDIAEQTNLLSLNATIEAARAGDAGKGFAVVAGEVKNLANQTAKATEDISKQIGNVQGATGRAVDMMTGIAKTIDAINNISITIAGAVEEQSAATDEITRNIQEAAQGTDQVRQNIKEVATGATDTGNASRQVLDAADGLSEQSKMLQDQMGKFLSQLRAA